MRLKQLFSLGMAAKQPDYRTHGVIVYHFPSYGSPTRAQVQKFLRKFFDKKESEKLNLMWGNTLAVGSEREAKRIAAAIPKLWHKSEREDVIIEVAEHKFYRVGNLLMDLEYTKVCRSCEKENPPAYRTDNGVACRLCNGAVVRLSELKPKEIRKYVEDQQARAERASPAFSLDEEDDEAA